MASNNFELHAKADEWMDVTPKEELLQNELDRLKEAFEKCSTQLDACRLENDLLKGFKTNLETETQQLKESLQVTQQQVTEKTKAWDELNEWTSERMRMHLRIHRSSFVTPPQEENNRVLLTIAKKNTTTRSIH